MCVCVCMCRYIKSQRTATKSFIWFGGANRELFGKCLAANLCIRPLEPAPQSPAANAAAAHLAKIKAKCVTKLPITYKTRKTVCARAPGRWQWLPPLRESKSESESVGLKQRGRYCRQFNSIVNSILKLATRQPAMATLTFLPENEAFTKRVATPTQPAALSPSLSLSNSLFRTNSLMRGRFLFACAIVCVCARVCVAMA